MLKETDLQIGDILLYKGSGIFGWLTRTKTWSDVGHVEIYVGNHTTITASAARGVDFHPLRLDFKKLRYVRRPLQKLNLGAAIKWFVTNAKGQKYDGWGLFRSFVLVKQGVKNLRMFCSEVSDAFLRGGGVFLFDKSLPPDAVSPAQFKQTNDAETIWSYK